MNEIELKLFILEMCPYCIKVNKYLDELLVEEQYQNINIKKIDERIERDLANAHDYYLVPTFYYGDEKLLEGRMGKEDVRRVLDLAIEKHQNKQS